jgi:hypothetical protein
MSDIPPFNKLLPVEVSKCHLHLKNSHSSSDVDDQGSVYL